MHKRVARAAGSLTALLLAASLAQASVVSLAECAEGAEFIANAARARDNGMTRADFLSRLDDDLVVIRAFPPSLRWFARDAEDEDFLRGAARRVFERPRLPGDHQAEFFDACLARGAA